MYKIGDFSNLVNSSIRTLRFYDEIDLFKPDNVDMFTGYRYYSDAKIEEFKTIEELKEAGFTLEEIKRYWNNFDEEILLKKKRELYQENLDIKDKIRKVDYLRTRINSGKIERETIKKDKVIRR